MTTYRLLILVTLAFAAGCGDNGDNRDHDAATACADPASCGACGTHCDTDQVCASGACVATCPSGTTACNGACVDTTSDVANCGACGAVCSTAHGTATCAAGTCGVAACADGSYGLEGACHACTAIAGCATESCTTAYESTCLACEPGNYLNGNTCVACSGACAGGSYQTAACSATADRTCGACTPIAGCTDMTCSSTADSACMACSAGSYLDQNSCHACSTDACPAGSYESIACSATADRTCSACTAIPGCTDEVCTTSGDATCQACAAGTYLSGNACVACSTDACPAGTYETAACSATADRACSGCAAIAGCADEICTTATDATCLACAPGAFLSGNACVTCSDACPTGTYETTACSATADRTCGCTAIANCTAETCSNATDESCTTCSAGHYVSGGTCATCSACRPGEFEETACGGSADVTCAALDCYTLHIASPALGDGTYKIDPDGAGGAAPFDAYCDMTTSGGGWTLLMKVDGSLTTFTYASPLWTNATPYQPDSCALDEVSETKSAGFATMPFTAMRVGMFDFTDAKSRWLELEHANSSLLDLFTSGYQPLAEGRDAWKSLVARPSLQPYCNMEGFNVDAPWGVATRIGIVSNQEYDCGTPDSRIGIGTQGDNCGQDASHSSGDEARCGGDGGDVSTPTFGYVMVRNCPGGVCDCGPSLTSCGSLCFDTQTDPKNCGACGYTCGPLQNAADSCAAGTCQITCNPGWADCDQQSSTGCETNIAYDDANCGACGNACATGLACRSNTCLEPTELRIDNPNHATLEYLPQNDGGSDDPAEGTCTGDCSVHPTSGDMGGVRLRSPSGFASGCDKINQRGQCVVYLPGHVVLN